MNKVFQSRKPKLLEQPVRKGHRVIDCSQRIARRLILTETTQHESVFEGSQAEGVRRRRSGDASQRGGAHLRDLRALDQALVEEAKGERRRGVEPHTRSSSQEGGDA